MRARTMVFAALLALPGCADLAIGAIGQVATQGAFMALRPSEIEAVAAKRKGERSSIPLPPPPEPKMQDRDPASVPRPWRAPKSWRTVT